MADWSYFSQISKSAVKLAADHGLIGSRRSGWMLRSVKEAERVGIVQQAGTMQIFFVTPGEKIREKYQHGPLICEGGELADNDHIRQLYRSQK